MGIGAGSMEPVNVAMIGQWWQREDRGFAVGAHHTGLPLAQFIGTLLIGAVVATVSLACDLPAHPAAGHPDRDPPDR